ncbi:hypothetical protein [Clostridium butyricum]|uniref:hypothetical protein n=1 Tax=Clostridium butyricum TaxID=1492 RepID=UPI0013D4B06F|nr:hypothetical protein [Clostridium butyricum]MCQ2017268.1 hypothetical protein [Clostridium butyricum]MCQ2021141.1 hypothetical protein [Clostridium butyricum]
MKKKSKIGRVKFLETNDENWYKLCMRKINFKQLDINDVLNKNENVEQIKFKI